MARHSSTLSQLITNSRFLIYLVKCSFLPQSNFFYKYHDEIMVMKYIWNWNLGFKLKKHSETLETSFSPKYLIISM